MTGSADVRLALTESNSGLLSAPVASRPALVVWERYGEVRLGEPGPVAGGLTAARFDGRSQLSTVRGAPTPHWTMAATVYLDAGERSGTILVVDDPSVPEGPVRALIVRRGRFAVLGWSWRGGLASWGTEDAEFPTDRWAHVAATLGENGDLILFVDGQVRRVFSRETLHPGRAEFQRVRVGGETTFVDHPILGWRGLLQTVELYNRALSIREVQALAHSALGVCDPEPVPQPPTPSPAPRGCDQPSHEPAWRQDGSGALTCLRCERPRGCAHDEHQAHWRPAGDPYRDGWWKLECGMCVAVTAARAVPAPVG